MRHTTTLFSASASARPATFLDGAARLAAPGDALAIIRHCAGYCRIAYSLRVTPPGVLKDPVRAFEASLRQSIETVLGATLGDRNWNLAGLSIRSGGLGIRHPTRHAEPAYIASFQSSAELAKAIDPQFDPSDAASHSGVAAAIRDFNQCIQHTEAISIDDPPHRQRYLSGLIDASIRRRLLAENSQDRFSVRMSPWWVQRARGLGSQHCLRTRRGLGTPI